MDPATLAFPAPILPHWLATPGLEQSGLAVRAAGASDLPFLRDLYAASRAAELACMPWPDAAKRGFCDGQFALQHRHYVGDSAAASFLVVEHGGRPVGRLYLRWAPAEMHLVDILLDEASRGRGIGSALLRWVQAATVAAGAAMLSLHVDRRNEDARRLYRRLGFEERGGEGTHLRMAWMPPTAALS